MWPVRGITHYGCAATTVVKPVKRKFTSTK
jgi:hypothetical protein